MAKVKPNSDVNPGLTELKKTTFTGIRERAGHARRKRQSVPGTYVDFLLDGKIVASIFGEDEYGLGSVVLADEGNRPLSSFVTEEADYAFPKAGVIWSEPIQEDWAHGTTNNRQWQIHRVFLSGVTFANFIKQ